MAPQEDDVAALLAELEGLPHGARTRRMIEIGRDAAKQPLLRALADGGGFYGRQLALLACRGSRDASAAKGCLTSSSRCLRDLALRVLADIGDDDTVLETLLGANKPELKMLLRKLRKAGRSAVLAAIVAKAADSPDRKLLELVLPYGSVEQVEALWQHVEADASNHAWSLMANYHPDFTAARVAAWPEGNGISRSNHPERIDKLKATQSYLLHHCPSKAWAILEGLPKWQLQEAQLSAYTSKFPGEMLSLYAKCQKKGDKESEGRGKDNAERKDEGTELEVATSHAPPVYAALASEAFMTSATLRLSRKLLGRANKLPDDQLLQALMQVLVGADDLLRVLPLSRRVALYDAWKADWAMRSRALASARASLPDKRDGAARALERVALDVQRASFNVWLVKQHPATSHRGDYGTPSGWLPAWLPHEQVADLLQTLIADAPELYVSLNAATVSKWLLALPGPLLFQMLSSRPSLLSGECPSSDSAALLARLTWRQQLELHRLLCQDAHPAVALALDLTPESADKTAAELTPAFSDVESELPKRTGSERKEKASPETVRMVALRLVSSLSVADRVLLLSASKRPCPVMSLSSMPSMKTYALAGVFEDWHVWWEATRAGLAAAEAKMQAVTPHDPGDFTAQLYSAVLRCMMRPATKAAFRPWLAHNVWLQLPASRPPVLAGIGEPQSGGSGGSGSAASSAPGPRPALLLAMHAASARVAPQSVGAQNLFEAALVAAAEAAAAAARPGASAAHLLSTAEADAAAALEPNLFLRLPKLLVLVSDGMQVSLMQRWAVSRATVEASLGTLLSSLPPCRAALLTSAQSTVQEVLLTKDPVATSALRLLHSDAAKATLFNACRSAWTSSWGESQLREQMDALPEPTRTELARAAVQQAIADAEERAPSLRTPICDIPAALPWLPWPEVLDYPVLRDLLNSKSAADRGMGLQYVLFKVAGDNPRHVPAALAVAHKRSREQDTVRQVVLDAVWRLLSDRATAEEGWRAAAGVRTSEPLPPCAVPDGILTIEQLLPAIGLLAGDAIAANDLSASSSRDLFRILLLALPRHPGWACGVMSDVVAVLGVGFVDLAALSAAVRSRVVALIEDHEAAAGERFKTGELDQDEGVNSTRAGRRVTRASGGCQEDAESMPRADCDDAGAMPYPRNKTSRKRMPCAAVEELLLALAGGLRDMQRALSRRQDGAGGLMALVAAQWEWACDADKRYRAVDVDDVKSNSALRQALTAQLSDVADMLAATSQGSIMDVSPVSFVRHRGDFVSLCRLILRHLPDRFLDVTHHVLPATKQHVDMFTSVASCLLKEVPKDRADLLLPFIERNTSMPAVAAQAITLLFRHHRASVPQVLPRLLAADPSFVVVKEVRAWMLASRQDLFTPVLAPPTAQTTQAQSASGEPGASPVRRGLFGSGDTPGADLGPGFTPSAFKTCVWLALPASRTQWKWTAAQQRALADELVSVLAAGVLSLADVKGLVSRIASLPAVPASVLLGLLDDPSGSDCGEGAGDGRATQPPGQAQPQPEAVAALVKDSVLSALVRLDDSAQAWGALVESVNSSGSGTALAAIGALMTSRWATKGDVEHVLQRLRGLPWQRVSVLREVVKVLGKLAPSEPAALSELIAIASGSAPGLGSNQPEAERRPLHRSVQQQLLTTLQVREAGLQPQQR